MKLVVVVRRIVAPRRSAWAVVAVFVMAVTVVMGMTVRGYPLSYLCGHRGGELMRRGTVCQDHDKGSNHQRKDGRQHDHAACRMPCPAMEGRLAHALRSLMLPYPPGGDIECL
ncbi:MAG: hypothetical protein MI785_05075 [Kiloniellales bacterium]|nr:hypothetical protein [Kiloniellales bacterium]